MRRRVNGLRGGERNYLLTLRRPAQVFDVLFPFLEINVDIVRAVPVY